MPLDLHLDTLVKQAVHLDSTTGEIYSFTFSRNGIRLNDDGSMSIAFHGIKNDTDRSGFEIDLHEDDFLMDSANSGHKTPMDWVLSLCCWESLTPTTPDQSFPGFIQVCQI